jgi:uncharacterized membrane protein
LALRLGPLLTLDLVIQPDAIAAIRRDKDGKIHVTTNHHPVAGQVTWGMLWGFLFGALFFVPLFGLAVGAGLGAIMGLIDKAGIDKEFQTRVRDTLQPATSALFIRSALPGAASPRRWTARS